MSFKVKQYLHIIHLRHWPVLLKYSCVLLELSFKLHFSQIPVPLIGYWCYPEFIEKKNYKMRSSVIVNMLKLMVFVVQSHVAKGIQSSLLIYKIILKGILLPYCIFADYVNSFLTQKMSSLKFFLEVCAAFLIALNTTAAVYIKQHR